MQDKYAGDIGDFGKFALLRTIAAGHTIAVCWYYTTGAGETNSDGKHTAYLDKAYRFRHLDCDLFDALYAFRAAVQQKSIPRSLSELEALGLLPRALYHRIPCPRGTARRANWGADMLHAIAGANLVFVDPDNGIALGRATHKHISINELKGLAARAPVLAYHHQTRRKGGASAEVSTLQRELQSAGLSLTASLRLKPYSSRFYFLVNGTPELRDAMRAFHRRWNSLSELVE